MEISLLIAEPNVGRSAVDQHDFILGQVPVLRQSRRWGKLLGTRHQMLRAVVFRADFQHELGGSGGTTVSVNAASPQLSFTLFQQQRLSIDL